MVVLGIVTMEQDFKHLVRIANTDLDGRKQILFALRKVKGVNNMFANAICIAAGVAENKKAGTLTDGEVKNLDSVLKSPEKYRIPSWLYNRRKDPESGDDLHLVGVDVSFFKDNDLKRMKMIRCYKGIRHMHGLPVRGQRTKSNFRKTKSRGKGGALGVKKRSGAKPGRV